MFTYANEIFVKQENIKDIANTIKLVNKFIPDFEKEKMVQS